jgi:hypothetical protein
MDAAELGAALRRRKVRIQHAGRESLHEARTTRRSGEKTAGKSTRNWWNIMESHGKSEGKSDGKSMKI